MTKRKQSRAKPQISLDMLHGKRGRGRPGVRKSEIAGRSYHYRLLFENIWDWAGEKLVRAKTKENVLKALEPNEYYQRELGPVVSLIPKVVSEPKFPKRRQAQIGFLADSLAGVGMVSPRRSRDICEQERNRKVNYITRQDYYIECTCHYKGPALHGKCPKCGTDKLRLPYIPWLGP